MKRDSPGATRPSPGRMRTAPVQSRSRPVQAPVPLRGRRRGRLASVRRREPWPKRAALGEGQSAELPPRRTVGDRSSRRRRCARSPRLREGARAAGPARPGGRPRPRARACPLSLPVDHGRTRAGRCGRVRARGRLRARRDQEARDHAPGQGGRPHASHAGARGPPGARAARLSRERGRSHASRPEAMARRPIYDFTGVGGVRHTIWTVGDPSSTWKPSPTCRRLCRRRPPSVGERMASGARLTRPAAHLGGRHDEREWFPAVLFPAEQLRILPYNRVITDLGGRTPDEVVGALEAVGRLSIRLDAVAAPSRELLHLRRAPLVPARAGRVIDRSPGSAALAGRGADSRARARPVLGIGDPRTDPRIDFVGGLRGPAELKKRVDSGTAALAVSLHPTSIEQLMTVSDAGHVMPPKSTWFEPKLRERAVRPPVRLRSREDRAHCSSLVRALNVQEVRSGADFGAASQLDPSPRASQGCPDTLLGKTWRVNGRRPSPSRPGRKGR